MPLNIVLLRPQNWSRLKPYYESTITSVKVNIKIWQDVIHDHIFQRPVP